MADLVKGNPANAMQNGKLPEQVVEPMNVYIWDMDETLILLKSLLDGSYARAFNGLKDARKGMEIGKRWEKHILQVCDAFFFYEEIENYNEPFLHALIKYDDGRDLSDYDFNNDGFDSPCDDLNKRKLAYRLRKIEEKYTQGLHKLLDKQMIDLWNDLYSLTDSYTDGWLSSAHALLQEDLDIVCFRADDPDSSENASCTAPRRCQSINLIVTSGSLIPSLVKCLLYQLDDVVQPSNVYSSWEVGKLRCFSLIKERFDGPNVRFCAIGDGMEECNAAEEMMWPFIKIELPPKAPHRFPGLNKKVIQSYIDVIYRPLEDDEADSMDEEFA